MTEYEIHEGELPEAVDDDTIYLRLGSHAWACRRVSVSWEMMKFAVAQRNAAAPIPHPKDFENEQHRSVCKSCSDIAKRRNDAGMGLMATMYDLTMKLLRPSERQSFEDYMTTADLEPEEFENAIGEVIAAVGSSQGKGRRTSSPSLPSEEKTSQPLRTISFAPGTGAHQHVT